MLVSKAVVVIFTLCLVHQSVSKPTTENALTEGRGIMSSIWGWVTYPFSWWSYSEPEKPVTEQLIGSTTTFSPIDNIEIRNQNVTIWCNDQTCTTMRCDKTECRNITCNLYDTDLHGECREYNIIPDKPEEQTLPEPTEAPIKTSLQSEITEVKDTPNNPSKDDDGISIAEEHPLELEAVLSSTVQNTNNNSNDMAEVAIPVTKV